MICPAANFEEIYITEHGAVYQCNRQNCYWLVFAGTTTAFKVGDFLAFKRKIDDIDVAEMIINPARTADFTIVMPFRTPRCFVLGVSDVLNLRELMDGAKFMITLNSVIHECLKVAPQRVV